MYTYSIYGQFSGGSQLSEQYFGEGSEFIKTTGFTVTWHYVSLSNQWPLVTVHSKDGDSCNHGNCKWKSSAKLNTTELWAKNIQIAEWDEEQGLMEETQTHVTAVIYSQ